MSFIDEEGLMHAACKSKKDTYYNCPIVLVQCKDCVYYIPYKDATGYGRCQSNHTFDGAFRDCDYCSYAKPKDTQN